MYIPITLYYSFFLFKLSYRTFDIIRLGYLEGSTTAREGTVSLKHVYVWQKFAAKKMGGHPSGNSAPIGTGTQSISVAEASHVIPCHTKPQYLIIVIIVQYI